MRYVRTLLRPHRVRVPKPASNPPLLKIEDGTFFKEFPSDQHGSQPLFQNLNFSVNQREAEEYWAITGPSNAGKTTLLEILAGRYICQPPQARSYPGLHLTASHKYHRQVLLRGSKNAIQYVGFGAQSSLGGPDTRGAYMSARYESRREETDFTLLDYLSGNLGLNLDSGSAARIESLKSNKRFNGVINILDLQHLLELPVANLSNGQTRRARIARAMTFWPSLLLLDEPFLGLDPMTASELTNILFRFSRRAGPRLVLSIPENELVPRWVTHVLYIDKDHHVTASGLKHLVSAQLRSQGRYLNLSSGKQLLGKEGRMFGYHPSSDQENEEQELEPLDSEDYSRLENVVVGEQPSNTKSTWPRRWMDPSSMNSHLDAMTESEKEPIVDLSGITVTYGTQNGRTILGAGSQVINGREENGLWWTVRRGERWGLFGPNGSGKTTLLSLISSDHPQAYSLPMKIFGRSRLPEGSQPGLSMFDLQARIGQASPEVHNYFPKNLTIRQTLENAWAETFLARPRLNHEADAIVDAALRWFRKELDSKFIDSDPIDTIVEPTSSMAPTRMRHDPKQVLEYLDSSVDWADEICFGEVSFTAQRVALFLRAIIKKPDLVILDESFGGLDSYTQVKCMMFLAYGETSWLRPAPNAALNRRSRRATMLETYGHTKISGLKPRQALINVSHRQEEVPFIVRQWLCLPSNDKPGDPSSPGFGKTPFEKRNAWEQTEWWEEVWSSIGKKPRQLVTC